MLQQKNTFIFISEKVTQSIQFVAYWIFIHFFSIQMHAINAILFYILIIFHIYLMILSNQNILFSNLVTRLQRADSSHSKKGSQSKTSKVVRDNGNYCIDFLTFSFASILFQLRV